MILNNNSGVIMLKRFEVENFKGFENNIVLDLSAREYAFNKNLVVNDVVNKAIVYGKNGVGKSSLGIAIFDIVGHLTDKERMPSRYLINYLNLKSKKRYAIFKYTFQFDEDIVVCIEKSDGEVWDIEIEKEENEDLGLVFEEQLIDKPRSCANKCIFCFMDQLPPKVRETLVFKDDDFRLSFMTGNYVTFTNSGYQDLDRIIKYHLSPINVSVHATDTEVRKMMLNNKNAGMILDYIKYLTDNGVLVQKNMKTTVCLFQSS